jgi:hypothetical protein
VPGEGVEVAPDPADIDRDVRSRLGASTSTGTPRAWASFTTSSTGCRPPVTFDTWVTLTSFVRGVSSAANRSRSTSPLPSSGATRSTAPVRSHAISHGTMFEWCSSSLMRTSSPSVSSPFANPLATVLIASVVLRVNTTSSAERAFRNLAAAERERSNSSVACRPSLYGVFTLAYSAE